MTNTDLLNEYIEMRGLKKVFIARQLGLTPAGFHNCVTNKAEFKASQINTLCLLLGITDLTTKEAIFFCSVR